LTEIERLLFAASGGTPDADIPRAACPRLGGISFLHRFGSALNHHVHLHACVPDGVFVPAAAEAACDAPPAFPPARPITPVHLAALGVWLVFYQENVPDPFWATGQKATGQKAKGKRQKAKGKRQKAKGKRQKAKGTVTVC
jgi:hypothetical protein